MQIVKLTIMVAEAEKITLLILVAKRYAMNHFDQMGFHPTIKRAHPCFICNNTFYLF